MEREVSHNDIYLELGELKGMMSALILRGQKDDEEKKDIFSRLNKLENRMAQAVLIAILAGLLLPPITSFLSEHFHFTMRPSAAVVK